MNVDNLTSLLAAPLQIYPNAMDGLIGEVMARLKSGEKAIMPTSRMVSVQTGMAENADENAEKSVLIIPVMKFISKHDIEHFGVLGTATIQKLIQAATADPNILGVVLHINNPGGSVTNTTETAREIFGSDMPIVAFCEDMACSSGYYLAMACKHVIAAGPTTIIGNIGTKSQGLDMQGILEKLGAKSWEIFATESYDKDLGFTDAMKGKTEKFQNAILNPFCEMFMSDSKMMRPGIAKEALHGMVYIAESALEKGLIDEIGSINDAVQKVVSLASQTNNSTQNNSKNMTKVTMSIPLAMKGAATALGGVEVTGAAGNTDIQAAFDAFKLSASAEKTDLENAKIALNAQVTALTNDKNTLTAKVTDLEAEKGTLTGKVAGLETDKNTLTGELKTLKASTAGAERSEGRKAGEQEDATTTNEAKSKEILSAEAELDAHIRASFPSLY